MNYLKQLIDGLKSVISSNGKETDFSKLKDLVPFLDSIRKSEISI